MMVAAANSGERRRYWFSVAALAVVLPAAILVRSGATISEWLLQDKRNPIIVERGASQRYVGADWRLTGLTRLPGDLPGSFVILTEFETTVANPALLTEYPCQVVLTDEQGRRWEPVFLTEPVVRQTKPEAADKPRCGLFEGVGPGDTVTMADSFVVPEDTERFMLTVTFAGALPDYLLFR
jgi:hypothetical protein